MALNSVTREIRAKKIKQVAYLPELHLWITNEHIKCTLNKNERTNL